MQSRLKIGLLAASLIGLSGEGFGSENYLLGGPLQDSLKHNIDTLTSPEFNGRDAPGPDADKAATFILDELAKLKELSSAVRPGSQSVPLRQAKLRKDGTVLSLSNPDGMFLSKWGERFYIFPRKLNPVDHSGEAAFCGYGLSLPEAKRNDYPKEIAGKVAIVKAGADLPADKIGMRANAAFKAAAAERAGAVGLVVVYTDSLWPPPELKQKIEDAARPIVDLTDFELEMPIAYAWMPGVTDEELAKMSRANLRVNYELPAPAPSNNIILTVQGEKDEWVVVGAHYDHLGAGYPGADDNASGVVGLLELAKRFSVRAQERGIIFVWFTAEEDGLLGSKWFVKNLPVEKEKIVAMINLDMIGREGFSSMRETMKPDAKADPSYAAAYFSGGSPALRDVIRAAVSGIDLTVDSQPVNNFRHFGDAGPFHDAQIPTMHIFSGFHSDYHAKSDTPDKINYGKLARMVDLTDRLIMNLAETPERPGFDPSIKVESKGPGY